MNSPNQLQVYFNKLNVRGRAQSIAGRLVRADTTMGDGSAIEVLVHIDDSSAYSVGNALVDLDREMRRTVEFRKTGSTYPSGRRGDLMLVQAKETESADIVLAAINLIGAGLLSDPVQYAVTLQWFWEHRPRRRGTKSVDEPTELYDLVRQITDSADDAIATGRGVRLHIDLRTDDGSMTVRFESNGED